MSDRSSHVLVRARARIAPSGPRPLTLRDTITCWQERYTRRHPGRVLSNPLGFFVMVPDVPFLLILLLLDVTALLTMERTSKAMQQKFKNLGIYHQFLKSSFLPLTRKLYSFICKPPLHLRPHPVKSNADMKLAYCFTLFAKPQAFKYALCLQYNLMTLVHHLEDHLNTSCEKIWREYTVTRAQRYAYGYNTISKFCQCWANEIIYLELMNIRLASVKYDCLFPRSSLATSPDSVIRPMLGYNPQSVQDLGNIIKIASCFKNRSFSAAGSQLRCVLFPVQPGLKRCYAVIHHYNRVTFLVNLICRPDLLPQQAALSLPNGYELRASVGVPMFPPFYVNNPNNIIVDIETESDSDSSTDNDEGDNQAGGGQVDALPVGIDPDPNGWVDIPLPEPEGYDPDQDPYLGPVLDPDPVPALDPNIDH